MNSKILRTEINHLGKVKFCGLIKNQVLLCVRHTKEELPSSAYN